jgi:outer membrane lipoprotein SlyB
MKTISLISAVAVIAVSAGCTFPSSGRLVSRQQVGQLQQIEYGTIQKLSPVVVGGQRSEIGTVGGGITGAAATNGTGEGVGRDLARAGGAVVGAVTGSAVEEGVTRKDGLEMMIKLDSGSLVVVTQVAPPAFAVGDRVAVASGAGGARVMIP